MLALLLAVQVAAAPVDCRFDATSLQFAGTPIEQAQCLLRPIEPGGCAEPARELPAALLSRVGHPARVDRAKLVAELRRRRIPLPATTPVSETLDHRRALYFVIHDTSSPWIGSNTFPPGFDRTARFNDVSYFLGNDAVAHLFNDRQGHVTVGHDLEVGWRATKLEQRIGERVRGRFLHVENVQPRREDLAGPPHNDRLAPQLGFTPAQYRTLGLLYVLASARAGSWLIPAFHANIDRGIPEAHDDPQNFDLDAFSREVDRWAAMLR